MASKTKITPSTSTNGGNTTYSLTPGDEELVKKVHALLSTNNHDPKSLLIREMLEGILKLHVQTTDILDIKILSRALKELRYAFRVFQPYRHCPKVSIFGSARTPATDPNFQLAARFGKLLSERGFMVITGAGPGIMDAGHQGAGKEHSFGVNIMLPFEQTANSTIADDPKLVHLKYFFTRKLLFVREANATALFPGGVGTMDEAFEVLTLVQTGKSHPVPIVCLEAPGTVFWEHWVNFLKDQLLPRGLISETDLYLFKVFEHEEAAVREIQQFYRNYHSVRYVDGKLVIRIQHPLTDEELARIREEFQDMVVSGDIRQQGPLPKEEDEPDLLHLNRVVLHHHRRDAGRLRQLIDCLNTCGDVRDQEEAGVRRLV